MKLPRRVRVGYRTYRLRPLGRYAQREFSGRAHRGLGRIWYDPRERGEELANTVVHELLHCLMDIWVQGEVDEGETKALANGLVASMQDNPEVWEWLIRTARR